MRNTPTTRNTIPVLTAEKLRSCGRNWGAARVPRKRSPLLGSQELAEVLHRPDTFEDAFLQLEPVVLAAPSVDRRQDE